MLTVTTHSGNKPSIKLTLHQLEHHNTLVNIPPHTSLGFDKVTPNYSTVLLHQDGHFQEPENFKHNPYTRRHYAQNPFSRILTALSLCRDIQLYYYIDVHARFF